MVKTLWLSNLPIILLEIIAILIIKTLNFGNLGFLTNCLLLFALAVLIRLIWNSAIVIHGLGHTIAIALVDRELSAINLPNILEQRSLRATLKSLLPFQKIFIPLFSPQSLWLAAGNPTAWRIRIKALGGIGLNLLVIWLAWLFLSQIDDSLSLFFLQTLIAANLIIAVCSSSDLVALITGETAQFYCGNFGFLGQRQPSDGKQLLPERMVEMFYQLGRETEIRGEQAGGGLILAQNQTGQTVFVGKKIVNQKRDNLTNSLEAAFAPVRKKAVEQGIQPLEELIMGAWHYRYATSGSPPTVLETHWHEWMSARAEAVWEYLKGKWTCQTKNVNYRITHNGDFDAWTLFEREIDNQKLGWWLERVLHTPNQTTGDSPKIAGMMDLLVTKGIWYASVRLAYQLAIASSIESAFSGRELSPDAPNTAPSPENLANWAKLFESCFNLHRKLLPEPHSPAWEKQLNRFQEDLIQLTSHDSLMTRWSDEERRAFVKTATEAFFEYDLYRATQIFMSKAKGSFGLVTVSTLEPENLVLSAKGQPISIGFNWQQEYLIYASEPAAVDRVLLGTSGSTRLDLNQKVGEVAKVSLKELTIYSLGKQRELLPVEIENRWISMTDHPYLPYIQFSQNDTPDPVATDIELIPKVLDEIKLSWQDPTSLNRQSADYLIYLFTEKVQRFEQRRQKLFRAGLTSQVRRMPTVDLLITGEENSLWLGEKFARDLNTIFPFLNIVTISANEVLQQLQQNFSELYLGKNSLVLAITQSGQTFSTVQAIDAFDHLSNQGIIGELFILTGELSSFINSARGSGGLTAVVQSMPIRSPNRHRIFVNGSGRRTAEPSTLSVAAAGQTLTELLFYLAKQLKQNFPDSQPFGMTLTLESLMVLEMMKEDFLDKNVTRIIGTTATGEPIKSAIRQKLIRGGRHWGLHVTETVLAWVIHAFYILISVGWVIPFGHPLPLVKTAIGLIFAITRLPQGVFELISPAITFADIGIYIFGPWLWTLLLRFCQGRQLLARMGKRTLVIGDVSWVNQLLQSYVSKLFSLSYGIASLEVHGANPQNHFLHAFGHRVVRGTLIFLGIPDGRRSQKLQEEENAVIMTGKQANGVRNINVGPEIVVMGHDPAISHKGFSDAIILASNDDSLYFRNPIVTEQKDQIEELRESCFGAFERLLASYVFFWALAKKVASFPLLKYQYWKSQSRTKIMTTASPVSGLDPSKFKIDNQHQEAKTQNYLKKN